MSKGFNGIPGNIQAMMKQAQKMQQQLQKAQEDSEQITAEGSAGGGAVKIVVNGKNKINSVTIQKEVVNPDDIDMLQDLVLVATNDALAKVQELVKCAMGKITGGVSIPGLV